MMQVLSGRYQKAREGQQRGKVPKGEGRIVGAGVNRQTENEGCNLERKAD